MESLADAVVLANLSARIKGQSASGENRELPNF